MAGNSKAEDFAPSCALFVLALAIIPLTHLLFLWVGHAAVLDGFLPGPDSYMRLVRVERLYDTGDWFDGSLPRSNWPYGEVLHWTRPADLLILAGALPLEPFLGIRQAIYWWGSATGPLLHMATALALIWMVAPRFDPKRRFLVVLMFLLQLTVWRHGVFGRTDHHMLILLVFVLSMGGALRVMVGPLRPRVDVMAGMLAGFGLWLSVELLVCLAAIFAAFTLRWLIDGGDFARRYLWHGLGLTAVVALALVVERTPDAWFAEEYDRISVVHLLMALLATAFWGLVAALEGGGRGAGLPGRLALAVLGAAVAGGAMILIYPGFLAGPYKDVSEELYAISSAVTAEHQPLWPDSLEDLGPLFLNLGSAVVAVPYLLYRIWRSRGAFLRDLWLLIGLGLLAYIPLALTINRFAPFPAILLSVAMADLVAHLLERMTGARNAIGRLGMAGLLFVVLFGPMTLSGVAGRLFAPNPAQAEVPYCPMDVLIDELKQPDVVGAGRQAVLTTANFGPMILYFTDHAVVTTLFQRNAAGQLDAFEIYSTSDLPRARELLEERSIDLVVVCSRRATVTRMSDGPDTLDSRLRRGDAPPWLRPLALSETARGLYRIYRVEPEGE